MGWIIFVVVLLLFFASMRRRAAQGRKRMNQQGAVLQSQAQQPVQTSQSYQNAQSMQLAPASSPLLQPSTWLPESPSTYPQVGQAETVSAMPQIMAPAQRSSPRPAPERVTYQGSTAVTSSSLSTTLVTPYQPSSLVTSLSSSLSSSLTDSPPRVSSSPLLSGIAVVPLPVEVADLVRFHLRNGHEVEAVRLVCDTMNVGLLEATKTVRSYA